MSQQNINISTPDDGLGDVLRDGFDKTNQNFTELYNGKVDKITGKGLSKNDFTDVLKAKLDGIEEGAQVNVQSDFGETDPLEPSFILNKPPSLYASVGYFDYNDLATQTTPISLSSGVMTKLTNDAEGEFTSIDQAPYLVSGIWNTTDNQFDFSEMSVGDTVDLRVDCSVTTTGTNKTLKFFLKFGIGTPLEFYKYIGSSEYKVAVTDEEVVNEISFYIGSEDIRTGRAELYAVVDTTGSIKVNGWYSRIIRKNLNVVEIIGSGSTPSLQQVTDVGNITTNPIEIGNLVINEVNEGDPMIIGNWSFSDTNQIMNFTDSDSGFSYREAVEAPTASRVLMKPNENGTYATREWVTANAGGSNVVNQINTIGSNSVSTTETITYSLLIPANTISVGVYDCIFRAIRSSGTGSQTLKIYLNSTNSLVGASLVGQVPSTTTARYMPLQRFIDVKVLDGTSLGTEVANVANANTLSNDYLQHSSTTGMSNIAIDWTADVYLIATITASVGTDVIHGTFLTLKK